MGFLLCTKKMKKGKCFLQETKKSSINKMKVETQVLPASAGNGLPALMRQTGKGDKV